MEPKDQQLHKEIKLLNIKVKEFSALAAENSFFTNDKCHVLLSTNYLLNQ